MTAITVHKQMMKFYFMLIAALSGIQKQSTDLAVALKASKLLDLNFINAHTYTPEGMLQESAGACGCLWYAPRPWQCADK